MFGPVFIFCAPELVFDGTEGVGSRYQVLRSRTRFKRYRGRRLPFSCFARPDSISAVPRASAPDFMFCAHRLVFGGTEGVRSCFHVLRALTHFQRYRGRPVPFSCFALPDSFLAMPSALGPVIIFCASELVFDGTEGVGTSFHVMRARTHFLRYQGRRLPFSCFVVPDSFLAVLSASGPVFKFCSPRVVYSFSAVPRLSAPVFMICAPELIFGGTKGVGSRFHVLRAWTRFRRYRGSPV
jgi:hypothetical protein